MSGGLASARPPPDQMRKRAIQPISSQKYMLSPTILAQWITGESSGSCTRSRMLPVAASWRKKALRLESDDQIVSWVLPQLMPCVRLPGTGQVDFTFQVFLL